MTNQWMTPDAYAGRVDDPMSQRPYMWNNNNPITYSDPSGYCPLCLVAVPAVEIGIGEALTAIGVGAVGGAMATNGQEILNSIGSLFNAHGQMQAPGLPETIVGTNPKPSSGKRVNSGPLDAAHGGTGDAEKDFDKLTGGHSGPAPNDRPPGTLLGGNRVQLRPGTPSKGPRIDIPANGTKPPETLHYPQ
jgi:filamentous hemagglutinin